MKILKIEQVNSEVIHIYTDNQKIYKIDGARYQDHFLMEDKYLKSKVFVLAVYEWNKENQCNRLNRWNQKYQKLAITLTKKKITFQELVIQYIGTSIEKQNEFKSQIQDDKGKWNLKEGTVTFLNQTYPIQIMGMMKKKTQIWYPAFGFQHVSDKVIQVSKYVQYLGQKQDILEFTCQKVKIKKEFLMMLGYVMIGILKLLSFELLEVGDTIYLILIYRREKVEKRREIKQFDKVVKGIYETTYKVDKRKAIKSYFHQKGCKVTETSDAVIGAYDEKNKMTVIFDEKNEIKTYQYKSMK